MEQYMNEQQESARARLAEYGISTSIVGWIGQEVVLGVQGINTTRSGVSISVNGDIHIDEDGQWSGVEINESGGDIHISSGGSNINISGGSSVSIQGLKGLSSVQINRSFGNRR